ncbi:MAG TPA: hypothetical protein ENG48_08165 [Candidatus Atribacteria bacterium]|nr:hypothetical protein [Candidatus Atribacteria bacterium]
MQHSIVTYKKVIEANSDLRIDGEYFKPEYLSSENQLEKINYNTLDNVSEVKGGKRLPLNESFSDDGIPYIRAEDIRIFSDFTKSPRITLELHRKLKNYQTTYNDVLLTIVGNSIGDVGIVRFNLDKCNLTENCAKIVNLNSFLPEFVFVFFLCIYGKYQIHREKVGTAQPKLALVRIRKFKIPLLIEDFQSKIKELVNTAYKANKKACEIYSQAEQILLYQLNLLNWKPKHQLTFNKNYSLTQKAERIDAEYFQPKYNELINIIKSYKENYKTLGELVSIKKCIEPGGDAYRDEGVPFIRVSNLSILEINENNLKYISDKLYKELIQFQPKENEILLSKDATPGIAYHFKEKKKMIPSGGILRLKLRNKDLINEEYLTLVLNSIIVQEQIKRDIGGSVILHWRPDQVKETIVPILDKELQHEIKVKINESFSQRDKSKNLLEIAKKGVEMAIEENEEIAEEWINNELKKINKAEDVK